MNTIAHPHLLSAEAIFVRSAADDVPVVSDVQEVEVGQERLARRAPA